MDSESYTVTHLVESFRRALVTLAPCVEAVGVTWQQGEAYDDWDVIEETLFEVLVVASIRGDLEVFGSSLEFPAYGFTDAVFPKHSWVEVVVPEYEGTFALIRLNSPHGFGDICVVRLQADGTAIDEPDVVPWTADRQFAAQLRSADGTLQRVVVVTPTESVVRRRT